MQDRPSCSELVDAVREFIETEVVGAFEGRKKFHARVAANVLAIVGRELALENDVMVAEWRRLDALLGTIAIPADPRELRHGLLARNDELCRRIRDGDADADPFRGAVFAHLQGVVREKLTIANPALLLPTEGADGGS